MSNIYLPKISKTIKDIVKIPGSKSIANRVLILAAIAQGKSIIYNVPDSAHDVYLMIKALKDLGIKITKKNNTYIIVGCNGNIPVKKAKIFCGNSGTTFRFLTAILAIQNGQYILTGNKRMQQRPIEDLVIALSSIGAQISYLKKNFYPPIQINQFIDNASNRVNINGKISSQFLSSILMASSILKRKIDICVINELISKPYINITTILLKKFGAIVECLNNSYIITPSNLTAVKYTIEPDASSASYFLAIGAIAGDITIKDLGTTSIQGDKNFALILKKMGAIVDYSENTIRVKHQPLKSIEIDMQDMPDVAMTLAIVALFAKGTTIIKGISSWRVKETDRQEAMYNELKKLGATIEITDNSISITPPKIIKQNAIINTYDDHRMAMAFSLIAVGGISVTIKDYQCVEKTFVNYFTIFNKICY
ncbi:MAG TPA: 3-phosphoshikimate 1-carboxyvinyltransferase [Burkholderiales bacterium]|nr:3-phosphoshikimate 1-carboxyvinyltransferase [Burkholderiales bacterium]